MKTNFWSFLVVMVMLLIVGASFAVSPASAKPVVLRIGANYLIDTINPTVGWKNWPLRELWYDSPVEWTGTTNVEASLAESWTTSEDGKVWTFKIRKGIKFHDGTPCTAKEVAWTLNWILKNRFGDGYRCDQRRCVCDDPFEVNDSFDRFALICGPEIGGVNCVQEAWGIDVQASLHSEGDIDYYAIQTLDTWTPVFGEVYNGESERLLSMTYMCPDGWSGLTECSGWIENINGIEFCVSDESKIAIGRDCGAQSTKIGTLLIGVEATEFRGDCDAYGLKIIASYGQVF